MCIALENLFVLGVAGVSLPGRRRVPTNIDDTTRCWILHLHQLGGLPTERYRVPLPEGSRRFWLSSLSLRARLWALRPSRIGVQQSRQTFHEAAL